MKRKKIIIFSLVLIIILSTASFFIYKAINNKNKSTTLCDSSKNKKEKTPASSSKTNPPTIVSSAAPKEAVINTVGNTSGNLTNGGLVTEQGNWVFYSCNGIYRVMPDMETGIQKICVDDGLYLNVIGEWLYYLDKTTHQIYKIRTNGADKTIIVKNNCVYFLIKDNYIYYWSGYLNDKSPNYLCGLIKKNLNDGTEKFLANLYSFHVPFTYDNNYMYWISKTEAVRNGIETLSRTDYDGNGRIQLTTTKTINPIASDGWIYYLDNEPDFYITAATNNYQCNLWRVKTDGSAREKLCSSCFWFNIKGEYIYYRDFSGKLYKMKNNGSEKTEFKLNIQLLEYNSNTPHLLLTKDYILIFNDLQQGFYKIKYDGSIQRLVK